MSEPVRIGVLTSGGDAPGMNAAVRAVVRSALARGAEPWAIMEGWQGAVDGGERIRRMGWTDVSSILDRGGTVIGTARSKDFRERSGRLRAAKNLVERGIDRLVVIGGDGSLSGTAVLRKEWPELLAELVESGEVTPEVVAAHGSLSIIGLVGSIDNDLVGTDTTIGTDTALHRIIDAIDQISSTAASHQRSFVIEVMGRHCGYLPLMAAMAGGCDYVLIPELPPGPGWEDDLLEKVRLGRQAGRRESLVLVAEGATDQEGEPITAQYVADVMRDRMGEDARVTILGHVQRGGTPSAYDRWASTILGFAAVQEVLKAGPEDQDYILGIRRNRIARIPLMDAVRRTQAVGVAVSERRYDDAVAARGAGFSQTLRINEIMSSPPSADAPPVGHPVGKRIAIVHAGGLAPGMNTAARAAVRLGIGKGYTMLGIQGGFPGLIESDVRELSWSEVDAWAFDGGAQLGTRRTIPTIEQLYSVGRSIETNGIDALLVIGGYNAYLAAHLLATERKRYPAFRIPIMCVPASIDNNLPGTELSIGADTAVNNAVWALDRVKESAAAARRCFIAETMGRYCGYLALIAGIASGAEMVYIHERQPDLDRIARDAARLAASFREGRKLFLVLRNEQASPRYNLEFMARAFEQEGGGLFDVRQDAIGHLQQGGKPSPFDRLLATRLVYHALRELDAELERGGHAASYIGFSSSYIGTKPLEQMLDDVEEEFRRPRDQWWLAFEPIHQSLSLKGSPILADLEVIDG
ncbi:MAG: 6-phosphofructokinase [Actinomycetales bacterium]|nr:6-phosphofructokinase [Actinomycetales bacterium]